MARIAQRVSLAATGVEIWRIPLAVNAPELAQLSLLLSRDEQVRALRFHFVRDRQRYLAARGMLRVLLGRYLAVSPAAIALEYGPNGKPVLVDTAPAVHFNVSHSGELGIIAIARGFVTGVDIESLDCNLDHDGLARRFFSSREYAALQLIPAAGRRSAFLACWTRKEAVAKATGQGLRMPLNQIEVTVAAEAWPKLLSVPGDEPDNWTLHTIDAGHGYVATLALRRAL